MNIDDQRTFVAKLQAAVKGIPLNQGIEEEILGVIDEALGGKLEASGIKTDLGTLLSYALDIHALRHQAHCEETAKRAAEWQAKLKARKGRPRRYTKGEGVCCCSCGCVWFVDNPDDPEVVLCLECGNPCPTKDLEEFKTASRRFHDKEGKKFSCTCGCQLFHDRPPHHGEEVVGCNACDTEYAIS